MFVDPIAVHLEAPVHRVCAELSETTLEIRFYILDNFVKNHHPSSYRIVPHRSVCVCSIYRVRATLIKPIIVNDSTQRVTVFLDRTARDAILLTASKEVRYYLGRTAWSPNNLP